MSDQSDPIKFMQDTLAEAEPLSVSFVKQFQDAKVSPQAAILTMVLVRKFIKKSIFRFDEMEGFLQHAIELAETTIARPSPPPTPPGGVN